MTEPQLLAQALRGDRAARTQLVMRHGRALLATAHALLGPGQSDAHDLVQETFLAVFDKGLASFRGNARLQTWLTGILINRIRKLRRHRHRRRAEALDADCTGFVPASASHVPSPATQVEQRLDVATMLEVLSDEYREVIVLCDMQGMSYAEMASILGIPERTAETRLTRARRALRERFAGYFD